MVKKFIWKAGVASLSLVAASGASAQVSENSDISEARVLQSAPIVVTARRVEENLQDIPVAISVVSGDDLVERGVENFADLSRIVPNLIIDDAGAERTAVWVTIRGQAAADVSLNTDSSVGLYMDGVNIPRVNGLSPGLVDLERVEVLKGPQGTLYGRNTTGGAVSFVTRAPDLDEAGGFASIEYGRFDRVDLTGAVNVPLVANQLAVRLTGRFTDQDGIGEDFSGREVGDEQNVYLRARLRWEPTDTFQVDILSDYTDTQSNGRPYVVTSLNGFPPRAGLPAPTNALFEIAVENGLGFNFPAAQALWDQYNQSPGPGRSRFWDTGSDLDGFSRAQLWSAGLNMSLDVGDYWQLRSITGYRSTEKETLFDLDGTPFDIVHPYQLGESDFWSQEVQAAYSGDGMNGIIGAFASRESGFERGATIALAAINPSNPNLQGADITNKSWAIYAQGDVALTDTLTLTLGGRYTEEDRHIESYNQAGNPPACTLSPAILDTPGVCRASFDATFSDWSYLASLRYEPTDDLMLYIRTARGFRGGGFNFRGNDAFGFEPFRPEVVTDYEVGVKSELFDGALRLNVAAFIADYTGIQRSIFEVNPITSAVASRITNAASATIGGVEVDAVAQVTERLSFSGSVGWLDAQYDTFVDVTGDRSSEPFQVPDWQFTLGARYEHPTDFGSVVLRADYSWRDDQVLRPSAVIDADTTQAAYGLLSMRAEVEIEDWNTSFALFGHNLTNERYIVGVVDLDSSLGYNIGFQGTPRTWGIQITTSWGGG